MRKVILDIETVSVADLRKIGALNYALHPSTRISIICWKDVDEEEIHTCINPMYGFEVNHKLTKLLRDVEAGRVKLICHNATFERRVINACYGTNLKVHHFIDTMTLSNIHRGPASLLQSARFFGIEANKDTEGAALMRKMCVLLPTPVEKKAGTAVGYELEYGYVTNPDGTELAFRYSKDAVNRLVNYCKQDVITTDQLYKKLTSQRMVDRLGSFAKQSFKGAVMTAAINSQGVKVDLHLLYKINQQRKELEKAFDDHAAKHFKVKTGNQRAAIIAYLKERGVHIDGLGLPDIKVFAQENPDSEWTPILLKYAELNKSSLRKAEKANAIQHNGRLYDQLHYCGASATGRWSSMGFQLQNLPRPSVSLEEALEKDGDPVSALRATIIPDDEEQFFVADLKQIELRMALYKGGYATLVDKMDKGHDLYKDFASSIFKIPMDKINDIQRGIGKTCMLSLQYGGGPAKLQMICNQMDNVNITLEQAEHYVKTYRTRFSGIVNCWRKYDINRLPSDKPLSVPLATGRSLYYGRLVNGKYFDGRFWSNLWGGIIFQHTIQAECRDLLLIKMNELFDKGYKLRLTIHDEVVVSVDEERTKTIEKDWISAGTNDIVKYWPGLALDSDISFNERYYK